MQKDRNGLQVRTRSDVLEELEDIGVNIDALKALSISGLEDLLAGLNNLLRLSSPRPGRPKYDQEHVVLSETDKSILKYFLLSQGSITSMALAKELDMPFSTIQRRRKRIEETMIETSYQLKIAKLGWREATLSISTINMHAIGKEILEISDAIVSVSKTIGDTDTSLAVRVIFQTNLDLMTIIDQIKEKEGVKKVSWSESIEVIGKSNSGYVRAIDSL